MNTNIKLYLSLTCKMIVGLILLIFVPVSFLFAQVSGTITIPSTNYPSIKSAFDSLNSFGAGTGGVIFEVTAGYTETAANLKLTTTSTSVLNQIVFRKSGIGFNPVITAATGTGSLDGIIIIEGTDYVTFEGIDLRENSANTTAASQMEWGYAILKAAANNGSRFITISGCRIALRRYYYTNITYAIYSANHTSSLVSELTVNDTSGTNSFNKYYGNTIDSSFRGIYINGYNHTTNPYRYYDHFNEVGVQAGNSIYNIGSSATTNESYGVYARYQDSLRINNNVVNTDTLSNGAAYGVYLGAGSNSTVWVSKNSISVKNRSNNFQISGIEVLMGDTISGTRIINKLTVDSNLVENSYPNHGAYSGTFTGISVSSRPRTVQINGNTVRNNIVPGTGTMYLIYLSGMPSILDIYDNSIYSNRKTGASGYMYCITSRTSKTNVYNNRIYNDSIPYSSGAAQMQIYGIYNNGTPLIENYYNNEIYNLGIGGSNTNGNNFIRGIYPSNSSVTDKLIYGNRIYNLTLNLPSVMGGAVSGIYHNGGDTTNLYNNRVFSLYATTGIYVWGVYLGNPTVMYAYNNYVHNLYNPSGSWINSVYGVHGGSPTRSYIYNNTIYLDASSSNTSFGSAGLYIQTTWVTDIRNNIIINKSVPGGGSFTSNTTCLRFSSASLSNYDNSSDRNNFYAGSTSDTNRAIFFDGTNKKYTLSSFKSFVSPREQNSVTENTIFRNTSTVPYDVRPDTTRETINESRASSLALVTTDGDGIQRYPIAGYPDNPLYPATAPDIGADEFGGIPADVLGPSITYTQLTNTPSTSDRTLSANIKDSTGVPISGSYKPRIYFKKNFNGTWYSADGNIITGNGKNGNWDFTISHSMTGGVTGGDSIYYFVIAQDTSLQQNISAQPGSGLSASDVNTISVYPSNPDKYKILYYFAGTYTVGSGRTFPDLDSAAKFYNVNELQGAVLFELHDEVDSSYTKGTLPITFNQNSGSSFANTLTIKPSSGINVLISGKSSLGIIKLKGADYVTIDGSNGKNGDRNISIIDSNEGAGSAVWIASLGTNAGSKRVTIKNCNIKNGNNGHVQSYALQISGTTFGSSGDDNDSLTIQNNLISQAYIGIVIGASSSGPNDVLTISGNIIGSGNTTEYIRKQGIYLSQNNNILIKKNRVYNVKGDTTNPAGISLSTGNSNVRITQNDIDSIIYTGSSASGGKGIDIMEGSNITIDNNILYCISGTGYNELGSHSISGIRAAGTVTGINIYYNTVNLFGNIDRSGATNDKCASLYINSGVSAADIRNNIFSNSIENTTGTNSSYSIYSEANSSIYTYIDNNDYFAFGSEGVLGYIGGSDKTTISDWKTATGKDINSISLDPAFYSSTYLKPLKSSPVIGLGTDVPGIVYDIIDTIRSSTSPSAGAYEKGIDTSKPVISYTLINDTSVTSGIELAAFATITDESGIDVTAGFKPRLYFRKITNSNTYAGNTPSDNGWKWTESTNNTSPFGFSIDYSLLYPAGTVSIGDTIEYFVTAQDKSEFHNTGINKGIFNVQPVSVNLGADAFPVTGTNKFAIKQLFAGAYHIGFNKNFPNLDSAVKYYNSTMMTGPVIFYLDDPVDSSYADATCRFPIVIKQNPGTSKTNTLTIKPNAGNTCVISGEADTALIKLFGANNIIINGSNTDDNSSRNLILRNTKETSASIYNTTILLSSAGNNKGSSNNTIKNCNISCTNVKNYYNYGIYFAGLRITDYGNDNDSITIFNNKISKAFGGIYVAGGSTSNKNTGIQIKNNIIGDDNSANYIRSSGIYLLFCRNTEIASNEIYNFKDINSRGQTGMSVRLSEYVSIKSNIIHGLGNALSYTSSCGIILEPDNDNSNTEIINNVIYDITGTGGTYGWDDNGISLINKAGRVKVYFNSVNMYGQVINTGDGYNNACIYISNNASNIDLRNNVFSNQTYNSEHTFTAYSIYSAKSTSPFSNIDYNDYYVAGSQGILGKFADTNRTNLSQWRTATSKDTHSISVNPLFNSYTNLIPLPGSPITGAGYSLSGYDRDLLDSLRGNPPTMGAYESSRDASGPDISYSALGNTMSFSDRNLTAIISDFTGIPITDSLVPRIYFRKNYNGAWVSAAGVLDTGTGAAGKWNFTISQGLMGGLIQGDSVYYYLIAQDTANPPRVNSVPEGANALSVNTITEHPELPNIYKIINAPLSGSYTIGLSVFNRIAGKKIEHKEFHRSVTKKRLVTDTTGMYDNKLQEIKTGGITANEFEVNYRKSNDIKKTYDIDIYDDVTETYSLLFENGAVYNSENVLYKDFTSGTNGYINSRGVYTTITAAINDINERGVSGPVTFYLTDTEYPSETYPINIRNISGASPTNTITIKPSTGMNPVINCLTDTTQFLLNGANYFVIDGSNTEGGTTQNLSVYNSSLDNSVFKFINDSRYNHIKNIVISGKNQTDGLVYFGSTTGPQGNDSNKVESCVISDSAGSSNAPIYGIYCLGSGYFDNDYNIIKSNKIYNFSSAGIYLVASSGTGWVISGNSIYRENSREPAYFTGIGIYSYTAEKDSINNNYIGGTAPECGGQKLNCRNFTGIYISSYKPYAPLYINGNSVNNVNVVSNNSFYGIYNTNAGAQIGNISGNYIGSMQKDSSIIAASSHDYIITGIYSETQSIIANNNIANLNGTHTTQCTNILGIRTQGNPNDTFWVYNNKIYNVGPTSSAVNYYYDLPSAGILLAGFYNKVYNNSVVMGKNNYNNDIMLAGIWLRNNYRRNAVYNNSVYLTGKTAEVSSKVSCGILKQFVSYDTLLNNSVYSDRTRGARSTSKFYSYYLFDSVISNYNNLFVYGGSFPVHLSGTDYTFDQWKAKLNDTNSTSENPYYRADTLLVPYIYSGLMKGGTPVSYVQEDITGTSRSTTEPSIGCYENGTDTRGPDISFTKIPSQTLVSNLMLTDFATISDTSGVNTTAGKKPRIYYKKINNENLFTGNTSSNNGWKYSEASNSVSPFSFTIDYSILYPTGTVNPGDIIQYFVVAQDLSGNENTGSNPYQGFRGSSVSSIISAPDSLERYSIHATTPLSGTYNIGLKAFNKASGKNLYFEKRTRKTERFTETPFINESKEIKENSEGKEQDIPKTVLPKMRTDKITVDEEYYVLYENGMPYTGPRYIPDTGRVLKSVLIKGMETANAKLTGTYVTITDAFMDINTQGISGAVKLLLTDSLYNYETFPLTLDSIKGANSTNTITLKPAAGVVSVIQSGSAPELLSIRNTGNIIIDGSNTEGGTTKNLTFLNYSSLMNIKSEWNQTVEKITIKNCNLLSRTEYSYGIYTVISGYYKDVTITNNYIKHFYNGIYIQGDYIGDTLLTASKINISNNYLDSCSSGITLTGTDSAVISGNNVIGSRSDCIAGISLHSVFNCDIRKNYIGNFKNTAAWSQRVNGIYVTQLNAGNHDRINMTIANNIIVNITNKNSQGNFYFAPIGIFINGNMGSDTLKTISIYNNTIYLGGTTTVYTALSCGLGIMGASYARVVNNYINNTLDYDAYTFVTAFYADSAKYFISLDNNNYYCNSSLSIYRYIGIVNNTGYTSMNSLRAGIPGKNLNSYNSSVVFTDWFFDPPGPLYPNLFSSENWVLNGKGMPLPDVTEDYLGNSRSTTVENGPTDIGAYEFDMSVDPPTATSSGSPVSGDTTFYTQSGRNILNILWGAGGIDKKDKGKSNENRKQIQNNNKLPKSGGFSWMNPEEVSALPTTVNVQKYSGASLHQADTTGWTNPAKRGTGYWKVSVDQQPTSPFAVTLYFGDEELGNITDPANNLILAKYDPNTHTWTPFPRTTDAGANWSSYVDWANRTVTVKGLTDFGGTSLYSEFALTDQTAPLNKMKLDLKAIIQGFYNGTTMVSDVMTVELRASVAPYTIIDQSLLTLDTSGQTVLYSYNAIPENFTGTAVNYWIVLRHRNSIETWSATTKSFNNTSGLLTYDFTTAAAQAYGDNQILVGGKYCIYNGDVNQDGIVDLFDLIDLDNDNSNFVTGVTPTDLNGDQMVDLFDLIIGDNNNANFVSAVKPPGAPVIKKIKTPEQQRKADEYKFRIDRTKKDRQENMNREGKETKSSEKVNIEQKSLNKPKVNN